MSKDMLAFDEEVDYLEYQQYLRTQSDSELFDIAEHLDYANCPRRAEAANRELLRRNVGYQGGYSESENLWRNAAILAILITALTIILGLTMSRSEAISPQPPPSLDLTANGSMFQFSSGVDDGGQEMTTVILGVYVGQLAENFLRDAVQIGSRSGIYLLMLVTTVWKLLGSLRATERDDPLSQDLRRLLVIAFAAQIFLMVLGACSHLPRLVNDGQLVNGGFVARAVTLIAPWG